MEIKDLYKEIKRQRWFNKQLTDDDVQELVVKLYNQLQRFEEMDNKAFVAFIDRSIKNLIISRKKLRIPENNIVEKVESEGEYLDPLELIYSEENNQEQLFIQEDNQILFKKALNHLKEEDRKIILLWSEGESSEQIAETIGDTPGNVRVKINRIKKKLKVFYENNRI